MAKVNILKEVFRIREENLKNSFDLRIKHNLSDGRFKEDLIKMILEVIPQRYSVSNGFIIDSEENTSKEIDLIIYDEVYVPRFFIDTYAVIPIESVVGIVQVKTTLKKSELLSSIDNLNSIDHLKPKKGGKIITASNGTIIEEKRSILPLKILVTGKSTTPLSAEKFGGIDIVYALKGEDYNNLFIKQIDEKQLVSVEKDFLALVAERKDNLDYKEIKKLKLFNFSLNLISKLTLINNSLIINYEEYLRGDE